MIDFVHNYRVIIELLENVDYFDIIQKVEKDLKKSLKSEYNEITVFNIEGYENRVYNTTLSKMYCQEGNPNYWFYYFQTFSIKSSLVDKIAKNPDINYKMTGFSSNNNNIFDELSKEEYIKFSEERNEEFQKYFVNEIVLTDEEKSLLYNLKNHPLIKNCIKSIYWKDKIYMV